MTPTNAPEPEREKFEAWGLEFFNYGFKVERDDAGDYLHDGTDTAWFAWQARAALAPAPQAPAPEPLSLLDKFLAEAKHLGIERFTPEMVEAIRVRSDDLVHPATTALEVHATLSESDRLSRRMPDLWRHIKTGGVYEWLMVAMREEDRAILVIYRGTDGVCWARPAHEFYDGRFQRLSAPADPSQQGCVPAATAAGSDVEDATKPFHQNELETIVLPLMASKGWMRGYAEAFVDDFVART